MIDSSLDNEILSYVTNNSNKLVPSRCSRNIIQKHNWIEYLEQRYDDFTSDEKLKESLYRLINKIQKAPRCYCGNTIIFKNNSYSKFCSPKCRNNDLGVLKLNKEHVSQSLIETYKLRGNDIKQTRKNTLQQKYNATTSSPFSAKCIYDKSKIAINEKYGVNNIFQLDKCRNKIKEKQRENSIKLWKSRGLDIEYTDYNTIIIKNCCKIHGDVELDINTFNNRTKLERISVSDICIKCNPLNYNSGPEIIIKKFLDEFCINYEMNTRKIIKPLELDFYLPDFKLAIEFNGLYYHCNKPKNYHLNKTIACNKIGIQLIHIWENDWMNNKDLVISMLKNRLLINQNKIYGRNCIIKEIDSKTSRDFINKNHLQGNVNSSFRFGLFYNNELVEVMTFGKSRRVLGTNENLNTYELYRLCSKQGYYVIGGASKLFKFACNILKNNGVKNIITYAKRDWSIGNVYYKLGFEFIWYTAPGYFWANSKGIVLSRYKTQHHKLHECCSETEYMNKLGYFKCYDSGNLKFNYKII